MNEKIEVPDLEKVSVDEMGQWFLNLKEQKLFLQDIGLTNKTFYDWRDQEVVPPTQIKLPKENYKELKFSFFENIWLQIVKDLRLMGLSYGGIRKISKELWCVMTEEDMRTIWAEEIIEADKKNNPEFATINKKIQEAVKEHDDGIINENVVFYLFEIIILSCILKKTEAKLLLRYDGLFGFLNAAPSFPKIGESEQFSFQEEYHKEFVPFPHLIIPIDKYLKDYFYNQENSKKLLKFGFVNQDEYEVLEVIRTGNLREITVKMNQNDNTIKSYTYTTDADIPEEEFRKISRSFFLKDYESVTFKRRNNKSVYFEKTTMKKMNE